MGYNPRTREERQQDYIGNLLLQVAELQKLVAALTERVAKLEAAPKAAEE